MTNGRRTLIVMLWIGGASLVTLGASWKYWHSPQMFWSPEQAAEYTNALRDLKQVATGGQRRADPATQPKVAEAQARFDSIKAKLETARTLNDHSGIVLVAAGACLIALAIWIHVQTLQAAPAARPDIPQLKRKTS